MLQVLVSGEGKESWISSMPVATDKKVLQGVISEATRGTSRLVVLGIVFANVQQALLHSLRTGEAIPDTLICRFSAGLLLHEFLLFSSKIESRSFVRNVPFTI